MKNIIEQDTQKRFILIGPRHSGKTSVGKALAQNYNETRFFPAFAAFADLDDVMYAQTKKYPGEILAQGLDVFQDVELETLKAALEVKSPVVVIAAGGGISENKKAIELLKNTDIITVYLEVTASTAWERIKCKPLPKFLQTENPEKTHREIHERRAELCRNIADIVIHAEGKTPDIIKLEILVVQLCKELKIS
jgi:shikimate kinase